MATNPRPSCTVVLCTYNGSEHLAAQLGSILNQSRQPDELVVSDDASNDGTLSLAEDILANIPSAAGVRIRMLASSSNVGVAKNFSNAIRAASGDVILLADQDDIWLPYKLERLLTLLSEVPSSALAVSNAEMIGADGAPLGYDLFSNFNISDTDCALIENPATCLGEVVRRSVFPGMTFAFRNNLRELICPIPSNWPHDYWIMTMAACLGGVVIARDPLVKYRQHGENVVGLARHTLAYRAQRLVSSPPTAELYSSMFTTALTRLTERRPELAHAAESLQQKAQFERWRASLPAKRRLRLLPICSGVLRGGYRRYASNGSLNALRDALRPREV